MLLLSIGGSDPSGGAGIQSDIKTFEQLGAYGLSVITALTAQNTTKFTSIQPASKKILNEQLEVLFSDFKIDGIKISMVYNSEIIKIIHKKLKDKKIPIVIDPVIKSTTKGILLKESAVKDFKKFLIPLADVITPNKFEAEFLTKIKINSKKSLIEAAKKIQKIGAKNVVITGMEEKGKIQDFILEKNTHYLLENRKIVEVNHGSGCNYSSALIFSLSSGKSLKQSTIFAKKFTFESINNAMHIGKGIAITENKNKDKIAHELSDAISKFVLIKNIYKQIPECQTNFVFSKKNPKSTNQILGIQGRIVKTGKTVIPTGILKYGGSKHVAAALIAMNEKFPQMLSAINLKYDTKTISRARKKLNISNYDRTVEPGKVKNKEGSTVRWGVKNAIKNSKTAPDLIFHKGDFGKEPMIIIFGKNPSDVLKKISKII